MGARFIHLLKGVVCALPYPTLPYPTLPYLTLPAGAGALLDQSQVTGESAPVRKGGGDFVIAGSIVRDIMPPSSAASSASASVDACAAPAAAAETRFGGHLVVEATRVGKDSFIQQLVMLVERAQASKAPIQVRA